MPSPPPNDPTCVVRAGETLEVVEDGWVLPDGTTRADLDGCDVSPAAILRVFEEDEPEPIRSPPAVPIVPVPVDVSPDVSPTDEPSAPPDVASPDDQHTATIAMPPTPPRLPPESATQTTTVVMAAAAVGAAAWMGAKAIAQVAQGASSSQQRADQQRKEEERKEREQCNTASDGVLNDFRARTADLKMRRLAYCADPVELWRRCDDLEHQIDYLAAYLRARARTRRA